MAAHNQVTATNMDPCEAYFRKADLDQDGRISGAEAVAFFQGSNLPKQVLAQIWTYADQNRTGFLGRVEFYNALKLVTVAQSKRELTADIVKAALYGPASTKIPPPQINISSTQASQANLKATTPVPQLSSAVSTAQSTGISGPQGFPFQQSPITSPLRPSSPSALYYSQQGVQSRVMPGAGTIAATQPLSSNESTHLLGGRMGGSPTVVTSAVPNKGISPSTNQDGGFKSAPSGTRSMQPKPQAPAGLSQLAAANQNDTTSQAATGDSKAFSVSGNGFASNSVLPDALSTMASQHNQNSLVHTSSSSSTIRSSIGPAPAVLLPTAKMNIPVSAQSVPTQHPIVTQRQHVHLAVKQNQGPTQSSESFRFPAFPSEAAMSLSGQSQLPWPMMTQSDIQKYRKVFLQVDTDRDEKITGEQAHNLFLSWRLPREVLKQVWDLSDQDNDSMLSLREFCIALYLMERYREGHPLPAALPGNIMVDEMLLAAPNPPSSHTNSNWRPASGLQDAQGMSVYQPITPGLQQAQGMASVQPVNPVVSGRPPRPVLIPKPGEAIQPKQQKAKVPVLEKHLLDQLSTEEQNSLQLKFQEAAQAENKVELLEKEILDSRQKIEFCRVKMQELVLYKSRCDNRLNEITERLSADKQEAESLSKKYEEKYKQVGDVASKLTIEETTFRDIQEEKMELYRTIVKLEQDGSDGIQVCADKIQSKLEELVKALNERCKHYGLHAKPTSLMELPFGWQHGIQEGAADWDEDWDKFEDEGFTSLKELTLDVENVIAPPRPKASLVPAKIPPLDEAVNAVTISDCDKSDIPHGKDTIHGEELMKPKYEDIIRSPSKSPARRDAPKSPSKIFQESQSSKNTSADGSPHATETRSELGGVEYVFSGDRSFDEPSWGAFDTQFDTDVDWDVNSVSSKDMGQESSFFDSDNWGLKPIKTGPAHTGNILQKGFAFDSVPSTPLSYSGNTPHADIFQKKNSFADSVPSTPLYTHGNSPHRFGEASEEHSFDSFSRFDSYSMYDGGGFPPSISRFDSIRSTRDSGNDQDFFQSYDAATSFDSMHNSRDSEFDSFGRFDSMHSTRDSQSDHGFSPPRDSLSRFDSMRSTRDSEYDHGLFQPNQSLSRFDSFRSNKDVNYNHGPFPSSESFTLSDSIHYTRDSDYGRMFSAFDDSDHFGSIDQFKSSKDEIPRRDSNNWKAF